MSAVRHNEDELNTEMARLVLWKPAAGSMDNPHTKALLLLQVRTLSVRCAGIDSFAISRCTKVFVPIGLICTVSVTEACARMPGAAASVSPGDVSAATRLRQAKPLLACVRY
jgi:hypothetical protein